MEFQVIQEIRESNVLVLLYDISRIETIERLQTYWMPKIRKLSEKTPVVVVGNKIDLENEIDDSQMEKAKISKVIKSLVKDFKVLIILFFKAHQLLIFTASRSGT